MLRKTHAFLTAHIAYPMGTGYGVVEVHVPIPLVVSFAKYAEVLLMRAAPVGIALFDTGVELSCRP